MLLRTSVTDSRWRWVRVPTLRVGWGGGRASRPAALPGACAAAGWQAAALSQAQLTKCTTPCRHHGKQRQSAGRQGDSSGQGHLAPGGSRHIAPGSLAWLCTPQQAQASSRPSRSQPHLRKALPPVAEGEAGEAGNRLGGGEARVGAARQRRSGVVNGCIHVGGEYGGGVAAGSGRGPWGRAGSVRPSSAPQGRMQGPASARCHEAGAWRRCRLPKAVPRGSSRPHLRAGLAGNLGGDGLQMGGDCDWRLLARGSGGEQHRRRSGGGPIRPAKLAGAAAHARGGAQHQDCEKRATRHAGEEGSDSGCGPRKPASGRGRMKPPHTPTLNCRAAAG